MRMVCFVPDANAPGKHDVTGAFLPEARAFCRYYDVDPANAIKRFPTAGTLPARRTAVLKAIRAVREPLEVVAFFCHGWLNGLQAGFQRTTVLTLASALAQHAERDAHVLLYACDTARAGADDREADRSAGPGGDGGFADELRDALEAIGRRVTVMGHATAGHCSWNPYARLFAPGRGGVGGEWYVEPKSALWPAWVRALRDPRNTLRLRFWGMTPEEIAEELGGGGPLVA